MGTEPAQGVYVDVLIAVNFMIDFLLLSVSGRIAGRRAPESGWEKARLFAAALIGALFSLSIFLPDLTSAGELAGKLLASGLMVLAANRWQGFKQAVKEWGALFLVTALFGGLMLAVQIWLAPDFMLCANGVVYFHLSPLLLIINVTAAYVIVRLADRLFQSDRLEEGMYPVTIFLLGRSKKLTGFVDTGNGLTEPFSGLPVIVCGQQDLKDILPEGFLESQELPDAWKRLIRMVPYHAVDAAGMLPALKGERLLIEENGKQTISEAFYLAVSKEAVGDGRYQVLLNRELLKAGVERTEPKNKIRV